MSDIAGAPASQIAEFRSDGVSSLTGLRVPFMNDAFARQFGFPSVLPLNMIAEAAPHREERPYAPYVGLREIRYSRPGLVGAYAYGAGPIRGLSVSPPADNATLVMVSGHTAFDSGGADLGFIAGTDRARFASSRSQMVIVADGIAHLFNQAGGNVFTAIDFSFAAPVSDVACIAGRFVYTLAGSDTFYWSEVDDAANVQPLSFATAELRADPDVAVAVLGDNLLFLGGASVETWSPDASAGPTDPAFTPNIGADFPTRGCGARDTTAAVDNTLFWLGDDGVVYRAGSTPARVSSSTIEDKISEGAALAACSAFACAFDGHAFYVLTVPGVGTFAYDASRVGTVEGAYGDSASRGQWAQWSSFGQAAFRGGSSVYLNGVWYVGDTATNAVWSMAKGVYSEGGAPLTRQASAFIKVEEGRPRCSGLICHAVQGVGLANGPGAAPVIEMNYSDDLGRTFSPWRPATLGAQGDYRARAYWSRLGRMRAPGRLVNVRCSDPVNVALSHLELNPARPAQ